MIQTKLFEDEPEPDEADFVCDAMHVCERSREAGGYHCMRHDAHGVEDRHLFGTTCHGFGEELVSSGCVVMVGRCDLAPRDYGYALVPNHLVGVYPLDPESGSALAVEPSFVRYCHCHGRVYELDGLHACGTCGSGNAGVLA